jgi:hypothetical protein
MRRLPYDGVEHRFRLRSLRVPGVLPETAPQTVSILPNDEILILFEQI